jgi:hypothetical protein
MTSRSSSLVRGIRRGTLAAAAMVAAALAACNNPQGDPAVKTTTVQQPAGGAVNALGQIEAATGIRLPPGTTVIQHARASDSDALVRARLAMSPEQLSAFLGALSLTNDAFEEDKRYLLGTNDGWWNPKDPAVLPTAQLPLSGAKVLNVGVDRADPQRPQVYFLWHGT